MTVGNHNLGTIRGSIQIDYDGAGIVKAVRDTRKAKGEIEGLGKASGATLKAFGLFSGGLVAVGGAVNTLNTSVSIVAATLGSLGPIAIAGFAALPGVIAGAQASMAVLKIATSGVGDALDKVGEDSKKFEESLKGLSGNAQLFVRAVRANLPVLENFKETLQDAFFERSADAVGLVVGRIAQLRDNAAELAGTFGRISRRLAFMATTGESLKGLNAILSGANDFFNAIDTSLGRVVEGFIMLAGQMGQFGDTLGEITATGLNKFADLLNRIDLASLFTNALPYIGEFGILFGNVANLVSTLFGGLQVDALGLIRHFNDLVSELVAFFQAASSQAALQSLSQAFQAIGDASGPVFIQVLQSLAEILTALSPALAVLAQMISDHLVGVLQAVTPLLVQLSHWISENVRWLGPLALAVVAVSAAYKTYVVGARAVEAVTAFMDTTLGKFLARKSKEIFLWLRSTVVMLANKTATLAVAAATRVATAAGVAWRAVQAAMVALTTSSTAAKIAEGSAWVASTAATVANRIAVLASTAAMGIARAATIAWTAVTYALGVAMKFMLGPVGLIITAVGLLVAGIIYLWKNNETFRNIVLSVWHAIQKAVLAVVTWFMNTALPALQKFWNVISMGLKGLWMIFSAYWGFIFDVVKRSLSGLQILFEPVFNFILSTVKLYLGLVWQYIQFVVKVIMAIWNGWLWYIRNLVVPVWQFIWSMIKKYIDLVVAYFQFLWTAVKAIWDFLWKGLLVPVVSAWVAIQTAVRYYVTWVKAYISAIMNFLKAFWNNTWGNIKTVAILAWRAIVNTFSSAAGAVKNQINRIGDIIKIIGSILSRTNTVVKNALRTVVNAFRGVPNDIVRFFDGLEGRMFNKGKAIVQGFIDGIKSLINKVKNTAQDVVTAVTDFLPGSPAKTGPLSGKGYVLLRARRFMNDFSQGLDEGADKPVAALMGAVGPMARAVVPGGSATKSGGSSTGTNTGTTPAGGTRIYSISIGDKKFAEAVVDAITGEPVAVNKASNEGARKSAWSGSGR